MLYFILSMETLVTSIVLFIDFRYIRIFKIKGPIVC